MATLTRKAARCVGTISGNQPQVRLYPVGSTLTVAAPGFRGDFVKEGAAGDAGKVIEAASPIAADDTLIGVLLHGVAVNAAGDWYLGDQSSPNAGDSGGHFGGTFVGSAQLLGSEEGRGAHVAVANDDNIFELGNDAASAIADLGAQVQIELLTGIWEINVAGATKSALVVAIPNYPDAVIGDTNQRYWVQFLSTAALLF